MDKDNNNQDKQSRIRERREALKEQSRDARKYRDNEREFAEDEIQVTINTCIMELFYPGVDRNELNTFEGWIKQGYAVKKGEKVLINLWGRPRKAKQDETEDEYQFWPLVFLFHRSQVEPLKNKQPEAAAA